MAKTLAEIKADYQYTDKQTGEVKDRTINTPHYFRDIPRIYSPNLQDGYMDFCPKAQKLYCYFQGWENSGNFCYESQTELGKVIDLSRERTCKLIQKLQDAGLITKEKNPGYRSKVYRTFPITDAHITPPEALTVQPDIISDVVPEPATAEETQDDATEKSEPLGLPETITDEMKIDAVCDLLSKSESLRQQSRGDTFINYARRVLHRKSMKLPSRFEEELEMRFEHRYPHFYGRFGTPF
ncbi:helix-turn-helix domain-containing protein [Enterobacter asburiae]|uniref:helix-turn-helix domain-containing protein n=1 Tax=Enterobacteriaceae TaxID=543 RepID=UPI00237F2452|nr:MULTISPECIES: helix-turn-helix domain-containing protein [Enterobacteriaceae]MDE4037327.1 helix-turn-helix domain-containing protein [Enterobacter asburiae]MDE4066209.1 helix-turn-helix domain-containing protein [Enterobacter asburiae]MDE4071203.1 helix-turn-helix domain-containing protein [Enterobacter asburiae]MDK7027659.1 helix-turn-helix domain-containing protein [Klebsiella grimontii]